MTAPTTAPATLVEQYLATWNETDGEARRALVTATFTADAAYADPRFAARGHDELDAMIDAVHGAYPGCRFVQRDAVEAHHDRLLWHWDLLQPDGVTPLAHGLDVAVLAGDGRLRDVTGFFRVAGH